MNEFERACYLPNLIEPQQTVSSGNGQGFLFLLSRYIPLAELSKKKLFRSTISGLIGEILPRSIGLV